MAGPVSNLPEYSVGELSRALRKTIERSFDRVRVRGEISGFKRAASGHMYMAIKDADALIDAVCWRTQAPRLSVEPQDGLEVIATGRVTTYAPRSRYQIIIESIEVAGEGALLKVIEDRRRRLEQEGLFDPARKQDLPYLPGVIGVVTSPTGAVFRDILHRLRDRFPREVLLWPVPVQGDAAAAAISAAVRGFDALPPGGPVPRPDVLIVGRGGGSVEDLMAFNEEEVVRAIHECRIPVISAVGHETDVSLADHAADVRAPTPTAAAERAVPVRADLRADVLGFAERLVSGGERLLESRRMRVGSAARALRHPLRQLAALVQRVDDLRERSVSAARLRIEQAGAEIARSGAALRTPAQAVEMAENSLGGVWERIHRGMESRKERSRYELGAAGDAERMRGGVKRRLEGAASKVEELRRILEAKNPTAILKRGFVLVKRASGGIVRSAGEVAAGERVSLGFHDGDLPAEILGDESSRPKRHESSGRAGRARPAPVKRGPSSQKELF